jgi:hypothetical protein
MGLGGKRGPPRAPPPVLHDGLRGASDESEVSRLWASGSEHGQQGGGSCVAGMPWGLPNSLEEA